MTGYWFALRQVWRSIRRQPGFFIVGTLTLAVGFAAHFSAFTIVDRLLLSAPAGVQDPGRVFRLHVERADMGGGRFLGWQTPYLAYQQFREHSRSFSALAAYRTSRTSVGTGEGARTIDISFADQHYFPLLGVSARLGRVFGPEENQAPSGSAVLVLSDGYWRTAFAADPSAIGASVLIGTRTFTVIGVMPPGFRGDAPAEPVDAWAPLHAGAQELPATWTTAPLLRSVMVMARLAPGASQGAAAAEAASTYRRFSDGTPAADATALVFLASLLPGRLIQGTLTNQAQIALWLQGVALLVLLVAIANVVNLQLSRAAQQRRELAVRVALGAGRRHLVSTLILEVMAIAGGGTLAGTALTLASAGALHDLLMPGTASGGAAIAVSRFALVAAGTLIVTSTVVAGLALFQAGTDGIGERLKSGRGGEGFSRARLRQGLLVAQVVMSALLLICAGLFLRSIVRLGEVQYGMDLDRVLAVTVPLRSAGFSNPAAEDFYSRAVAALAALPGVETAAAAQSTPFAPSQRSEIFLRGVDRVPLDFGYPTYYTVTPSFFDTMGVRTLRGRRFTDADRAGAPPVVIVEAALAAVFWPGQDPIGQCMVVGTRTDPCREVIGVASNTRRFVGSSAGALRYYIPLAQRVNPAPPQALLVRTSGDPAGMIAPVRRALLGVAGNLPYAQIRVLRSMAEPEMRPWRLGSTLFVLFGAAALFVATAGVYSLLSFLVTHRSREIGVRLALGATPLGTLRMIVSQSLAWAGIGVIVGCAAAAAAGRFLRPLLFETSPYDLPVYAGTAAALIGVALAASLLPALRASRVDPNVALRAE